MRAARLAGLNVQYVQADYLEWHSDQSHDLVALIMCDFCALAPSQRSRLLANVASWLAPGGAFLFDVYAPSFLAAQHDDMRRVEYAAGGFWSAGPHTVVSERVVYREAGVLLDRYTIEEPGRTWTVWNWLQVYDPEALAPVLASAGLRVEAVLGNVAGRPYDATAEEFAVVVRRAVP